MVQSWTGLQVLNTWRPAFGENGWLGLLLRRFGFLSCTRTKMEALDPTVWNPLPGHIFSAPISLPPSPPVLCVLEVERCRYVIGPRRTFLLIVLGILGSWRLAITNICFRCLD